MVVGFDSNLKDKKVDNGYGETKLRQARNEL